jgi:hypothetical protein
VSPDGRWLYATSELDAGARPTAQSQGALMEMALEPNARTLLVGDFGSDQLEAVDLSHLPSQ